MKGRNDRPAMGDMALAGAEGMRHSVIAVVEKMENPWGTDSMDTGTYFRAEGFERCRGDLLVLLQKGGPR